ncbi:hypothetical protein [Lentzea sp. NBRC 105346]|uniref:hypothetical protein n=1 Tax=Lentzea sp. NBRC 105346 TaxID=3032205 RepID=UPI002555C032|nr:hypothetical protein [Lentzea sp. NBRC 105346]
MLKLVSHTRLAALFASTAISCFLFCGTADAQENAPTTAGEPALCADGLFWPNGCPTP